MDSKPGRKTHLKKYLSHNGKWQFFPVVNVNGRPKPELVIIDGKPRRGTGGTFYLDWRENGKRRTRPVGSSPREALDAWQLHSGILSGDIELPEEEAPAAATSTTIRAAVESYLAEVKATKGDATWRAYSAAHAGDVEFWSPGNPVFPEPIDIVNREVATQVLLETLLGASERTSDA